MLARVWRRDRSRCVALLGALLAGVILALATYPAQDAWLDHRHADGAAYSPAPDDGAEASFQPFGDERRAGVDADEL